MSLRAEKVFSLVYGNADTAVTRIGRNRHRGSFGQGGAPVSMQQDSIASYGTSLVLLTRLRMQIGRVSQVQVILFCSLFINHKVRIS